MLRTQPRNIEAIYSPLEHNAIDEPRFDENLQAFFEKLSLSKFNIDDAIEHISANPDGRFRNISSKNLVVILDCFKTIIVTKQQRTREDTACETAIFKLHQKHGLAPSLIKNILSFFETDVTIHQILNSSDKIMRLGLIPSWICKCESILLSKSGVENVQ